MALIILGPMVSEARGSIGGTTFARNRSGAFARLRVVPTNPATARQTEVRALMATLQTAWRDTLTIAERDGWQNYAASLSLVNRVGGPSRLTGPNIYIRANSILLRAGITRLDIPPDTFGGAPFPVMTFTGSEDNGLEIQTIFPALGPGDVLQVRSSTPKPRTINYFETGFAYTSFFIGVQPVPYIVLTDVQVTNGTRTFMKIRLVKANGQVSQDFRFQVDIEPI